MACEYKHIFGKEGEGVHALRLFNIAIVDVIGTILGGILIAKLMNWNVGITVIALFALGIIMHRLFCVNSTVNKALFGNV